MDPIPPFDEFFMLPESVMLEKDYDKDDSDVRCDPISEEQENVAMESAESLESPVLPPTHPNSFFTIIETLLPLYRRVLSSPEYESHMHFCIDGKGTEKHARRVAYGIKLLYGIEFSWKVILTLEPTAEKMAERIQEARVILAPSLDDLVVSTPSAGVDANEEETGRGRTTERHRWTTQKTSALSASTSTSQERSMSPAEVKTRRVLSNLKMIRAERERRRSSQHRRRRRLSEKSGMPTTMTSTPTTATGCSGSSTMTPGCSR